MVRKYPNNNSLSSSEIPRRDIIPYMRKTEDITLSTLVSFLQEVLHETKTTREEVVRLTKAVTTGFDDVFQQLGDILNDKYAAHKKLEKLKESAPGVKSARRSAAP